MPSKPASLASCRHSRRRHPLRVGKGPEIDRLLHVVTLRRKAAFVRLRCVGGLDASARESGGGGGGESGFQGIATADGRFIRGEEMRRIHAPSVVAADSLATLNARTRTSELLKEEDAVGFGFAAEYFVSAGDVKVLEIRAREGGAGKKLVLGFGNDAT